MKTLIAASIISLFATNALAITTNVTDRRGPAKTVNITEIKPAPIKTTPIKTTTFQPAKIK